MAAFSGWRAANTTPEQQAPSDEEFERAVAGTMH